MDVPLFSIHLTKIGKLSLLEELYDQVLVPEKVYLECTESVNYTEEVALITNVPYIKKHIIESTKLFRLLYADIDAGESEALVLALEQKADLILLDDQEARIKARKLDLPVTGTLGVLLKAKNQGLIRSLKAEIQNLQASGFWLSQEMADAFLSHSTSRSGYFGSTLTSYEPRTRGNLLFYQRPAFTRFHRIVENGENILLCRETILSNGTRSDILSNEGWDLAKTGNVDLFHWYDKQKGIAVKVSQIEIGNNVPHYVGSTGVGRPFSPQPRT